MQQPRGRHSSPAAVPPCATIAEIDWSMRLSTKGDTDICARPPKQLNNAACGVRGTSVIRSADASLSFHVGLCLVVGPPQYPSFSRSCVRERRRLECFPFFVSSVSSVSIVRALGPLSGQVVENVSALIATRCDGRCCQCWRCIPARRLRVKLISCRAATAELTPEGSRTMNPSMKIHTILAASCRNNNEKQFIHLSLAPVPAPHQGLESRYCAVTRPVFHTGPSPITV